MKKKIILSDIFLLCLISISLLLIFSFVDVSTKKNVEYDKEVYKAYYVYDEQSKPISLSYDMIEVTSETSTKTIINKIFTNIVNKYFNNLQIKSINITNNKIQIELNEDIFTEENEIYIDCLINSLILVNNIQEVILMYDDIQHTYYDNIINYNVNSPIVEKLYSFLYKDKNYKIVYTNEINEEKTYKLKQLTDSKTTFSHSTSIEVKRDGLFLNLDKVLTSTYKVNDEWITNEKNGKIKEIVKLEDNTLLITVELTTKDTIEIIKLKQGLGLYYYELIDSKDKTTKTKLAYLEKRFIEN